MIADAKERDYAVVVCGRDDIGIYNHSKIYEDVFVKGLKVTNIDVHKPIEPMLDEPVLQLTPFFRVEDEATILPAMKHCVSARWNPLFTDITVKGADKGSALLKLAAHIGVAMGNANEEVQAAADYITTSVDEDGIRNAFIHFNIIEE